MKRIVFETSFEVCNKVGGINTVVSSKAQYMNTLSDEYFLIGPYFQKQAESDFKQLKTPLKFQEILQSLQNQGIIVHYGKWLIPGEPQTLLIEFASQYQFKNQYKENLWNHFGVDSLHAGFDFEEPIVFSATVAKIISVLIDKLYSQDDVISHTHEWMCGFVNLFLQMFKTNCKTIFTTHATMLGRSICGSGQDLYGLLETLNPESEAKKLGVHEKYTAEKASAQHCDVFTTVSELTAIEAEYILGRKPEVLLLNGLDSRQFPSYTNMGNQHLESKKRIDEFLRYFFYPYHTFDLEHTTKLFISGRHEVKNKGIDISLQALGRLNTLLKNTTDEKLTKKTIVCFIMVPYEEFGVKKELLEQKVEFRRISRFIEKISENMKKELLQKILDKDSLESIPTHLNQESLAIAQQLKLTFCKPHTNAPFSTHYINEEQNEILNLAKMNGLQNTEDDRVKIVYYPTYLSNVDTLLDMTYYEATAGCDLGVFCSYYEPWGYTPLEGIAVSVPVITTDLAGFGKFMQQQDHEGVFVLERRSKSTEDVITQFVNLTTELLSLKQNEFDKLRIHAKILSERADWKTLIQNYKIAQDFAIRGTTQ